MRSLTSLVLVLVACGTDVRPSQDQEQDREPDGSDPGVDAGGIRSDGGGSTTVADARVPPSDGIPAGLTPCEEAVYVSDLPWIQEHVFDVSCLNNCHSGANPGAGMDLSAGRAHAALVGVASTQHAGWLRVAPGAPAASMLLVQLGGEPGPELEGFMPWGQPRLCGEMIDAIRRWIAAGAPPP